MELFLIDAIGPFFRGYQHKRTNWSKIPFLHLVNASDEDWDTIRDELRTLARGVSSQGYNAVTLDDLAHLTHHPFHESEVTARITLLRSQFTELFTILHDEFGLMIYLTSDVIPITPAIVEKFEANPFSLNDYYRDLVCQALDDFPQLSGIIIRIGESDGNDVKDPIRTRLHLRDASDANQLLHALLPEFEKRNKNLIFRTWTVGPHPIGDLIWNPDTLEKTLSGIHSPSLIVSMKHSESDFFRYLPLTHAAFLVKQRKIIEFQARREYEGAGEYPSYIGWDCQRFAQEIAKATDVIGISMWCQTGGWHRFNRRAFLEPDGSDIWIQLNSAAAISIFKHNESPEESIHKIAGPDAVELLRLSEQVIRDLLYIGDFAEQTFFFRRVRIPPLLQVYWDSLFITDGMRKLMGYFVRDPEVSLERAEKAFLLFPRIIELAESAKLPIADIQHMQDFFRLLLLARRYFLLPSDETLRVEIKHAKKSYKENWPLNIRNRYRIKVSFKPLPVARITLAIAAHILLRRQREYRIADRLLILFLTRLAFRAFRPKNPRDMPKFLRKSAMGIDALFE